MSVPDGPMARPAAGTSDPLGRIDPRRLHPGAWRVVAQEALDDLAAAVTVDDAVDRVGTARAVTVAVLGSPAAGGHATRAAIRATGRLVTHRLGPALAAEALSWAAEFADLVDVATTEALLLHAADATATYRPLPVDGSAPLRTVLAGLPTGAKRRRMLLDVWGRIHEHPPSAGRGTNVRPRWNLDSLIDLDLCADDDGYFLAFLEAKRTGSKWSAALDQDAQIRLLASASGAEIAWLASSPVLFDLSDPIIGHCLVTHTRTVLRHPACPPALRQRIALPYDQATFELALLAGRGFASIGRMTRMLRELSDAALEDLAERMPRQLLEALDRCGLVRADLFVDGPLRHLDLTDPALLIAAFGAPVRAPERTKREFWRLLEIHPDAEAMARHLSRVERGSVPPGVARRLIERAASPVAAVAFDHLPPTVYRASDARHALALGGTAAAQCPGIAARQRPACPIDPESWPDAVSGGCFWIPDELRALMETPFGEAPGWTISILDSARSVFANARRMGNCTAGLVPEIAVGAAVLLVVVSPAGEAFNVLLVRRNRGWSVGEINSRGNGGVYPAWLRPVLRRRLATAPGDVDDREPLPSRASRQRRRRRRERRKRTCAGHS